MTDLSRLTATCGACGLTTAVPVEFAGRSGRCSHCGGLVRVPSLFEEDSLPEPPPTRMGTSTSRLTIARTTTPLRSPIPPQGKAAADSRGHALNDPERRRLSDEAPSYGGTPLPVMARLTQLIACCQRMVRLQPVTWSLIVAGAFIIAGLLLGSTLASAPSDRLLSETEITPPSEPVAFAATKQSQTALILVFPSLTWGKPIAVQQAAPINSRYYKLIAAADRSVTLKPVPDAGSLVRLIAQSTRFAPSWEQANGVLAGRRLDGLAHEIDLPADVIDRAPRKALAIEITRNRFARLGVSRTSGLLPSYLAPLPLLNANEQGSDNWNEDQELPEATDHLRLAGISPAQLRAGLQQYAETWEQGDAATLLASEATQTGLQLVQRFLFARYLYTVMNDPRVAIHSAIGSADRVIVSLREAEAFGTDGALASLRTGGWSITPLSRQDIASFHQRWTLSGNPSNTHHNHDTEMTSLLEDLPNLSSLTLEQLRGALGGRTAAPVIAELARRGAPGWDALEAYLAEHHETLSNESADALLALTQASDTEIRLQRLRMVINTEPNTPNAVSPLIGEVVLPRLALRGAAGAEALRLLGSLVHFETSIFNGDVNGTFATACRNADPNLAFIEACLVGMERDPQGILFQAARLWLNHSLIRPAPPAGQAAMVHCWQIVQTRALHDGLPLDYGSDRLSFRAVLCFAKPLVAEAEFPPPLTAPAGREVLLAYVKQWPETDLTELIEKAAKSAHPATRALAQEALAILATAPTPLDKVTSNDVGQQMRGWHKLRLSPTPDETFSQLLTACVDGRIPVSTLEQMLFFGDDFPNHSLAAMLPAAHAAVTRPELASDRRAAVALVLSMIDGPQARAELEQLAKDPEEQVAGPVKRRLSELKNRPPPLKRYPGDAAHPGIPP